MSPLRHGRPACHWNDLRVHPRTHGFVAGLRRRGAAAPGTACQEKASGGLATARWRPPAAGPRAVELRGREKPGRAGKSYGELPLPAHRHLQKQQPAHRSCRGRKAWEALFRSWLSRSWHFDNKLH